jgi:hypothetical protein
MRFGKKILYYLLGVGIGSVMVYFFFGDRDIQCSYFPNDRVLSDLRKKEIRLSDSLSTKDTTGLYYALDRAKVDFERTEKYDHACNVYYIDFKEYKKTFVIQNCDSVATIRGVEPLRED